MLLIYFASTLWPLKYIESISKKFACSTFHMHILLQLEQFHRPSAMVVIFGEVSSTALLLFKINDSHFRGRQGVVISIALVVCY